MNKSFKIGSNRGKCRVWLEGKYLPAYGFNRGERYAVIYSAGEIVLKLDKDGPRKVAGKDDKPILDIIHVKVCESMQGAQRCNVLFENGEITITPEK